MKKLFSVCITMLVVFLLSACSIFNRKKDLEVGSTQFEVQGNGQDADQSTRLRPARIRIKHVDDQVKDGLFIPAHLEYEISDPARWEGSK